MKILIDTNIILDLIQSREPFSENASKIINSCVKKENEGYISAHSLSDIFFILRKDKTVEERKALILNLCSFFIVIPEDKNFYNHHGYDLLGLSRSMIENVIAGHVVQGGSTITQQLSRMLFLSNEQTY